LIDRNIPTASYLAGKGHGRSCTNQTCGLSKHNEGISLATSLANGDEPSLHYVLSLSDYEPPLPSVPPATHPLSGMLSKVSP